MSKPENLDIESFFEVTPKLTDVIDMNPTAQAIPKAKKSSFAELVNELSLPVFQEEVNDIPPPKVVNSRSRRGASMTLFSSNLTRSKKKSRNRSKSVASNPTLKPIKKKSAPTVRFGEPGPVKVKSTTSVSSAISKASLRKRGAAKKSSFANDSNKKMNNDKKKTFLSSVSTRLRRLTKNSDRGARNRKKSMPNMKERKYSEFEVDMASTNLQRPRTTENHHLNLDMRSNSLKNDIYKSKSRISKTSSSPRGRGKKKSKGKASKKRSLIDTVELDNNEL